MELLSTEDVGRRLDVSPITVRQWCREGRLEGARKIQGVWIIPADTLDGFERPPMGRPPEGGDSDE